MGSHSSDERTANPRRGSAGGERERRRRASTHPVTSVLCARRGAGGLAGSLRARGGGDEEARERLDVRAPRSSSRTPTRTSTESDLAPSPCVLRDTLSCLLRLSTSSLSFSLSLRLSRSRSRLRNATSRALVLACGVGRAAFSLASSLGFSSVLCVDHTPETLQVAFRELQRQPAAVAAAVQPILARPWFLDRIPARSYDLVLFDNDVLARLVRPSNPDEHEVAVLPLASSHFPLAFSSFSRSSPIPRDLSSFLSLRPSRPFPHLDNSPRSRVCCR